jgi:hypothetical protein
VNMQQICFPKLRVAVQYGHIKETLIITCSSDEKKLLEQATKLFNISESWKEFILIIEKTNSPARTSEHLEANELLFLNRIVDRDLNPQQVNGKTPHPQSIIIIYREK